MKTFLSRYGTACMLLPLGLLCLLWGSFPPAREDVLPLCVGAFLLLAVCAAGLACCRRLTPTAACVLLFLAGAVLRLAYVTCTGYDERQHDVWLVTSGKGHMGYIQYIAEHLSLPDTNATWQFYHPPLHHLLAGLLYRTLTACGHTAAEAAEQLQFLTAFYSCAALVACERLLWHGGVRRFGRVLGVAVFAFHPTTLLFAGSLNNDTLLFLLSAWTLVFFVKWWNDPRLSHLLCTAVCLGLSMMAKTSGVLIAPAIAVAFCVRLWRLRRDPLRLTPALRDMLLFGAVSVPLGMWYPVRNLILFGQGLFAVPLVSDPEQQIGHIPLSDRLWNIPWEHLSSPYQSMDGSYSIPLSALKTSLFGEGDFGGGALPYVLLAAAALLCLLAVYEGVRCCVRPRVLRRSMAGLLGIVCATVTFSYLLFCFTHPAVCTQDFRYLAVLLCPAAVFLGVRLERLCPSEGGTVISKVRAVGLWGLVLLFCVASAGVYLRIT